MYTTKDNKDGWVKSVQNRPAERIGIGKRLDKWRQNIYGKDDSGVISKSGENIREKNVFYVVNFSCMVCCLAYVFANFISRMKLVNLLDLNKRKRFRTTRTVSSNAYARLLK